uniref:Thioredoxin-related protein n=1 Tax=Marseillevirus LCMAC102 TaxID=2506603 RepID=A0A481YTJ6_9VIRU|nr:MAG: thioredoxin-related protein [Marseillevirus LCMAC102]
MSQKKKKKSNYRPLVIRSPRLDEYGDEFILVERDYGVEEEPDEDIFTPAEDKDTGEDVVTAVEKKAGITIEEEIEYVLQKVPLDVPPHLKELAAKWRLDIDVEKLVPMDVRRKVRAAETDYTNVIKTKIGPTDSLQPTRSPNRVIKLIGDVMPPSPPHQKLYSPSGETPSPPHQKSYSLSKPPPVTALFAKPVTLVTRRVAVDELFRVFSEIIPTEIPVKEEKIQLSNDDIAILQHGIKPWKEGTVTQQENGWLVEWKFEGKKLAKNFPVGFRKSEDVKKEAQFYAKNSYYAENFRNWMYGRLFQTFNADVPTSVYQKAAQALANQQANPHTIIEDLTKRYKDFWQLDALQIKNRIRDNRQGVKLIDVEIQTAFEKIPSTKLQLLQGGPLAQELTRIIYIYLQRHPPNQNNIYKELVSEYIIDRFNLYKPTQEDRTQFETENLPTLTEIYASHIKAFQEVEGKVVLTKESVKFKAWKVSLQTDKYVNLSEIGGQVLQQIVLFERNCYTASDGGITNIKYLSQVLRPIIFLEGPLSKFTKFFKAKIASGLFQISALFGADLAYYFPEFAMNFDKFSDDYWEDAMIELSKIMLDKITDFLELDIKFRFPTARLERKTTRPLFFRWDKYTTNITARCETDTRTGKIPVRDDEGKIVYKKELSKMVAQYQPINLADVVICYDKEERKFSCHSITEILHDIAKARGKTPINPFTGKPYPKSFVKTIRKRYPEKLAKREILETPEKPKAPWTPEPTEPTEEVFEMLPEEARIPKEPKTLKELKEIIPPKILTVVYFYADWCTKCITFEKKWSEFQKKYTKVNFIKVDHEVTEEINTKYNIQKVPRFLLLTKQKGKLKELASVPISKLEKTIKFLKSKKKL